ncbi:precorrin-3B synthase [Streptomyces albus]|uniref:precorrin-3B synthase n=1 Tax=Streptomyces albus TaxID=1888 RepID=UPI001FC93E83|nr:precorrin-3B synthase [Streptomyces albus]
MPSPATPCPGMPGPPRRGRDDACPGALRLHSADDGALARVRLPGGLLTSRQARCLADVAEDLGDGELELTSRGNVQVRGLPDDCGRQLADRLHPVGLLPSETHERVRNMVVSPLSGLDGNGRADVRDWVRALDALLCANPGAAALSGRFLFAVDDGRGDAAALGADVTIVATGAGGAELRIGAGGPRVRVTAEEAPRAAVAAAEAFLHAAAESGTRAWRVRDLPRRTAESGGPGGPGEPGGRTGPPPSAAPDAPGNHALDADLLRHHLSRAGVAWRPAEEPAPGPAHAGDRPATGPGPERATGSAAGSPAGRVIAPARRPVPAPAPAPAAGPAPGLIRGPAPAGRCALSVTAPLGRYSAAQWRLLAETAERSGDTELRTTPWRGVVVPGLPPDAGPAALRRLADAGLVTAPDSPWFGVGSCAGRPGCAKSLADVRADAARAVRSGRAERATIPGGPATGPAMDGATTDPATDGPATDDMAADRPTHAITNRPAGDPTTAGPAADRPARAQRPTAPAPDGPSARTDVSGPPTHASGGPSDVSTRPVDHSGLPAGATAPVRGTAAVLPVYWSGCERRCGRPNDGGPWIDVLATGDGYRVAVNGTPPAARSAAPVRVPPGRAAAAIAAVARAASTDGTTHPAHPAHTAPPSDATGTALGTLATPGGTDPAGGTADGTGGTSGSTPDRTSGAPDVTGAAGPGGRSGSQRHTHPGTPGGTGGPDGTTRARTTP